MRSEHKTERVQIMIEPSIIGEIDDFRFGRRIGSQAEAVRQLLVKGLEKAKAEVAVTTPAE